MAEYEASERKQEAGQLLPGGKYQILKAAGKGGAGEVFSVYDRKLHKVWAAKRVSRVSPGMETAALGRMDAEIFPRIVDVVEEGECSYLIMDWIEGETLQERMEREGAMDMEEGIRIGIELCRAIAALHAMQPPLLYLDCKPSNIMLDKNGALRLIDFGSALESPEAEVMPVSGSFGYGAPEQFGLTRTRGGNVPQKRRADERSDIYGVGRTIYALLTGMDLAKPPYGAYRLRECNPAVSAALSKIVEKCTQEQPAARYQTMEALKADLEKLERNRFGFCKRLASRAVTGLLLGLSGWRVLCFYKIAQSAREPLSKKLLFLGMAVLIAASARLWQYFAVEKGSTDLRWDPEPVQSVLRTQKSAGRWLFAVLLGAAIAFTARNGIFPDHVLAEGTQGQAAGGKLPVSLRDEKLRRLLVKEGCALESAKPVYIELDPARFEPGKVLEIHITAKGEGDCMQEYTFFYLPHGE